MVRHYDSEQEAYATRHRLWEQRLQRAFGEDGTNLRVRELEEREVLEFDAIEACLCASRSC